MRRNPSGQEMRAEVKVKDQAEEQVLARKGGTAKATTEGWGWIHGSGGGDLIRGGVREMRAKAEVLASWWGSRSRT